MRRDFSVAEQTEIQSIIDSLQNGDVGVDLTDKHDETVAKLIVDGRVFDLPEMAAAGGDVESEISAVYRAAVTLGLSELTRRTEEFADVNGGMFMRGQQIGCGVACSAEGEAEREAREMEFKRFEKLFNDLRASIVCKFVEIGAVVPEIRPDLARTGLGARLSWEGLHGELLLWLASTPVDKRWVVLVAAREAAVFEDENCLLPQIAVDAIARASTLG